MKTERVITICTSAADTEYVIKRRGARVVIDTDTPAQARMIVRRIGSILAGEDQGNAGREGVTQAVGFQVDPEE